MDTEKLRQIITSNININNDEWNTILSKVSIHKFDKGDSFFMKEIENRTYILF